VTGEVEFLEACRKAVLPLTPEQLRDKIHNSPASLEEDNGVEMAKAWKKGGRPALREKLKEVFQSAK